ncbi:hypothetical protein G5714_018312 [Onychostoma macrolepis]|uniref:Uncharacterized protein n=1 Tax=Onychostoma macrolepis TaxID=369639 RepID=A0A7J6BYR6_9TELE|nr:hypothetical protein G5714_018312 [Onychostoma macrolepis]
MEYRRCQPPCSRFIASDDLHSKLAVFERESSVFPRRAPEAAEALRESTTWGSDVELEAMESEQTGFASSLPLSPEHVRVNSPVEFVHEYLCPSPEARNAVSFGLDNVLFTAASDSEDFRPALADAHPPSGQEARPSAAYSELVDVLSRATEKLSIDWPDEPRESQSSKLDERFLSGPNSRFEWRKLPFFSDLHHEISRSWKQPFSSRLTNAAATDFTNLKFRSAKSQSAALRQFMPRRARDHSSTPSSSLSRERSLPRKETTSRSSALVNPPPTTVWGACGRPLPHRRRRIDLTGLPLQLHRVAPDSRVGMRRVSPESSRGRARPFKRFCPPLIHSPHADLSHPPSRFRCAANDHLQSLSVWQSGDASSFLPLLPVPLSPAARMIGDTFGSLPQPSVTVDSPILTKDAIGFPSWWTTSPPPDLLDTPTQPCMLSGS